MLVNVVAIEERAAHGDALRQVSQPARQVSVVHLDAPHGSHRGLHHLGGEHVGRGSRGENVTDAKPVGNAHDGAHVARVLHAVERQAKFAGRQLRPLGRHNAIVFCFGQMEHGHGAAWGWQTGQAFQFGVAHKAEFIHLCPSLHEALCLVCERVFGKEDAAGHEGQQVAHSLRPFGHKATVLQAVLPHGQRAHKLISMVGNRHWDCRISAKSEGLPCPCLQ